MNPCTCSQCTRLIQALDKAIADKKEIERKAGRRFLDIYDDHYKDLADERFMGKVAAEFSY